MASLQITVACLLLVVACSSLVDGRSARNKRVVGGSRFYAGTYPYLVSLWYMGDNNYFTAKTPDMHHTCGGSLLERQWVLTSAACFDDNFLPGLGNTSLWKVAVGMHRQSEAEENPWVQFLSIEEVFMSNEYNLTESYGDIALLKLSEPAELNEFVSTVGFNSDPACPEVDDIGYIIGWGQTEESPYGYGSDSPREAAVVVHDTSECKTIYSSADVQAAMGPIRIDERSLCAGWDEGGADGCFGDSGSPLLCRCEVDGELVVMVAAVMSTGYGCARPGYPGVYGRVSAYSGWIKQTLEDNA